MAWHWHMKHQDELTLGQRTADAIAAFGGSWTFIIIFVAVLVGWIAFNSWELFVADQFDPYPYILLNLILSCIAALQAPIIMMSQNRQAQRDRAQADADYHVNIEAEKRIELLQVHLAKIEIEKLDEILKLLQK